MCFKTDRFVRYYVKEDSCVYHATEPTWMDPLHERRSSQNLPRTAIRYQIFNIVSLGLVCSVQQDMCSCVTPTHCTRLCFFFFFLSTQSSLLRGHVCEVILRWFSPWFLQTAAGEWVSFGRTSWRCRNNAWHLTVNSLIVLLLFVCLWRRIVWILRPPFFFFFVLFQRSVNLGFVSLAKWIQIEKAIFCRVLPMWPWFVTWTFLI